jgi:hypothetical protein
MTCLRQILGLVKNPNFHKIYLINCNDSEYENLFIGDLLCLLSNINILESETSPKTFYNENKKMTRLRLISGLVTNHNFHG